MMKIRSVLRISGWVRFAVCINRLKRRDRGGAIRIKHGLHVKEFRQQVGTVVHHEAIQIQTATTEVVGSQLIPDIAVHIEEITVAVLV